MTTELQDYIDALQRLNSVLSKENRVMSCREAAWVLGRSTQTISKYISEGKLHKAVGNGITGVPAKEVFELL